MNSWLWIALGVSVLMLLTVGSGASVIGYGSGDLRLGDEDHSDCPRETTDSLKLDVDGEAVDTVADPARVREARRHCHAAGLLSLSRACLTR